MSGIKHLIECHCFLKIFNKSEKQINHKFPVFSKIGKDGNLIKKLVKCNNCDALHSVYDICKSELKPGKEEIGTVLDKEDLILMLPDKIANILIKNNADISDFEHALDIVENKEWGSFVVVKRSIVDEEEHVKVMEIIEENKIKIHNKELKKTIMGE
tara:strand:- start:1127 stop:1597 length:471 start_codon:yes stop_codon:yes gene_type:complete